MPTHSAAVLLLKGQSFRVQTRPTPRPGPGELLIAVKAVALNPADCLIRDLGLFIQEYPAVIGFDVAGLVLEVGENVPSATFQPGVTRVAGYAAFAWKSQGADYGAFQERCIMPWQHAVPLHGDVSWIRAATLPVAVQVPLMAWEALGIPLAGASAMATAKHSFENTPRDINEGYTQQKTQSEALLIWGASSSVGTMGVQTACLLRDDTASPVSKVYATASPSNHTYIRSLGADHVFDHHGPDVVDAIVSAARADGLIIRNCFLAMGAIKLCQRVLRSFIHQWDENERDKGMIASAPPIPEDIVAIAGITTIFLQPSATETGRLAQFELCMNWLGKNLIKGSIRPSPEPQVVGKGLPAINAGLMMLMRGVSCTKLVVDLDD